MAEAGGGKADVKRQDLTPDKAYVANCYENTVSVIDTGTNTVTATVTVGTYPVLIAITP